MARRWLFPLAIVLAAIPAAVLGTRPVRMEPLQERGAVLRDAIMPSRFQGHWSEKLKFCSMKPVEENQVWITGRALNGYEVAGRPTRIVLANPFRAVVTIRSEGEGIMFVAKKELSLSADRNVLDIRDEDDTSSKRFYRCPAIVSAASAADNRQILAGTAFEELAGRTDAACPSRDVRAITPGDLDYIESDFEDRLPRAMQRRLQMMNPARRRCAGYNGLACPTTSTLEAIARTHLMGDFVAYICSNPNPATMVTVSRRRESVPSARP